MQLNNGLIPKQPIYQRLCEWSFSRTLKDEAKFMENVRFCPQKPRVFFLGYDNLKNVKPT